ncbi:MAG: type IV secretory system conjugative DNA transfer family protein [Candidatus Rokuibacteriota bacterium]
MTTHGPPRRPLQLPFAPLVFGRRSDTGDMVEVDADELMRHLAVFGTTGSGKTSLFLALMLQLMDRGRGFIFCTTKHDPTMPRALAWAAMQRQQLWHLRVFDPAHPVHVYNPTATTNPLALASLYFSQLPPIEPTSEAKHYHDIQFEFLLLACSAIMATGLRHVPNDILQLARSYEIAAPKLRKRLQALGKEDRLADLDAFFRRFYRRGEFQPNEAQEALSGLTSVLQGLDVGRFAGLLNQPFSEVDLLQACRRGLWVYMGLPAAMDVDGGQLGRLFLTDLIMAIDEIQRTEGELVHAPFVIFLDEFPSYALPQFARVFEQARSSGIGILLGAQTVSSLSDRAAGLSEGFRDRVLRNCANTLSFRLGPGEGAEYFSKFAGKADRAIVQVSETESRGRTWSPLAPSSWVGWTNRTDDRASFSGYRVQKDLVMESRRLTHELASRGQAMWLSPKGGDTLPFPFWSLWAETSVAPAGWDYASQCARWDRIPPPPLDLWRYVRFVNIRRSAAQGEAPSGVQPQRRGHGSAQPAPAAVPGAVAQPAAESRSPTADTEAPQGAPSRGRRRRRPTPQPTSLISYVSPHTRQSGTPEARRQPSAAPPPPPPGLATPRVSQLELSGLDDDQHLDAHATEAALDQDGDGIPD